MIQPSAAVPYPPAPVRPVTDTLHGEQIVDPYRWLEDGESAEAAAWVEAQNAATRAALDAVPGRDAIARRLEELLSIGWTHAPAQRGGRLFYQRREGGQNQPVLYYREGETGEECVALDPNALAADGTVALDWWSPSWDGRLLVHGLSTGGDERSVLHVLDLDRGELLPDRIPQTRAASIAWLPDSSGFFYTRFPDPDPADPGASNYGRHVRFHRLGTDPAADPLVFGEGREPTDWPWVQLSKDGRWLVVGVQQGYSRTSLYLRDEATPGSAFVPLIEGVDVLSDLDIAEGTLYLRTNLDAPNYRLFAVDPERPARDHWREVVPERPDAVLEGAPVIGGRLALLYLRNACSELRLADPDGGNVQTVALPAIGRVEGLSGEPELPTGYVAFSSFTFPTTIYALDPASGVLREYTGVNAPLDPSPYTVEQVWYDSTDGARVSMFLVHRRDLVRNGENPTVLTGYGGFNISRTPEFIKSIFLWLERGGVYALANLRGGGEYGEPWHRAGMLDQKQHTFDDFIAAAEFLIREGYTRSERLAIMGGSNGGLLVGAALTQRPDLFRAALCAVPLLDMLRYHRFEIARLWIPEYGDPDDPEQYRWLRAYSPYHHVRAGERYPAVLLVTAESDSRVDPMHARKMAARLQAASGSGLPVLLRIETKAGHGAGKPLAKTIAEQTDVWSFICRELGVDAATPARA
jgi:prolyl oligopeptidase